MGVTTLIGERTDEMWPSREAALLKGIDAAAVARYLAAVWTLFLIALMAFGTFSTARIGALTWGQTHDINSAAIAISQIKLGVSGGLAFREVEQAIARHVTSTSNSMDVADDKSRALAHNQEAISKGFQAAAAIELSQVVVPKTSGGYVTEWAEDVGYADFYNLAFRLFGFNAYATHWLYVALLFASAVLFTTVFISSTSAMASLVAGVSALFAETASQSLFADFLPNFVANRFVSTLALIPLLHVVCALLRRSRLRPAETVLLVVQLCILAFVIAARSSAQWSVVAGLAIFLVVFLIRMRSFDAASTSTTGIRRWLERIRGVAQFRRLVAVAALLLTVTTAISALRYSRLDRVYFFDGNMPNHMVWHSAFVGLAFHPDWPKLKPYGVGESGDGIGFLLFERARKQQHLPYVSPNGFYLVRTYEKFVRDQYFRFLRRHPKYAVELFLYYKPLILYSLLSHFISSINVNGLYLIFGSLLLLIYLFMQRVGNDNIFEYLLAFSLIWLCSLIPVIWAYPAPHVISDPLWATLFMMLGFGSILVAAIVRTFLAIDGRRQNDARAMSRHGNA